MGRLIFVRFVFKSHIPKLSVIMPVDTLKNLATLVIWIVLKAIKDPA